MRSSSIRKRRRRGKPKVVLFLHIPKTAGKTLGEILKSQYPSRVIRFDGFPGKNWAKHRPAYFVKHVMQKNPRCVYGHFNFAMNLHQHVKRPFRYITMLRDPVDRVVSLYYYIRRSPHHYLYQTVRHMSLDQFAAAEQIHENSNSQTIILAGSNDVELAKHHLAHYFSVVGITERFNESLFLMKRELGWRRNVRNYVSYHVSKSRPEVQAISPEVIQLIQMKNQSDMELYEFAKQLFEQKLNALDHEGRLRLGEFLSNR